MEPIYIKKSASASSGSIIITLTTIFTALITWINIHSLNTFQLSLLITFIGLQLFGTIYFWRGIFRIKFMITIDREGMLYGRKMIYWNTVRSFRTQFSINNDLKLPEVLLTYHNNEQLKIHLSAAKTNIGEMRSYIKQYAASYKIIDEGHFED
ncbi:hypothetical protein [Chitinophaga sp. CF118]|uniref:hypothetical protein n=1 Tax=Chitinophaga sp. CF118 TaxID=1884367 RepID=UPI001160C49C|nr:hypothetical protein [Chitinophaga sp. CF118]